MLKKNCIRALSIVLVFAFLVPFNAFATTLNEDVSIARPLEGNMETAAEAAAVDTQLTGTGSSAALTDDSKQGSFSLKVTVTDEVTNPYAAYILVDSDPFSIASYISVTLWVKPGAGADWIEFYTNSTLITCDENGDGRYEVGTELLSGKWNEITLNLLNTETGITQGVGLTVRTDEYSTWSYDGVCSNKTNATSIDLSTLVNGDTQLNNGNLEFPLNGESTAYEADPTVLVSNNEVVFDKTYTTQADFRGGAFEGGATNNVDGSISLVSELDACSDGTAISGGYYSSYVPANAFDNSTNTMWESSQSGSGVNGAAYIGYSFSGEKEIFGLSLLQSASSSYAVTSVNLQYYDDTSSSWLTAQTFTVSLSSEKQVFYLSLPISAQQFRVLANSATGSSYWRILEVELLINGACYISQAIDISTASSCEYGYLDWNSSEYTTLKFESSLSIDSGTTWGDWYEINDNGTIQGINSNTNLQNTRLKYRVTLLDYMDGVTPTLDEVHIQLIKNSESVTSLEGKLTGIAINSDVQNAGGESSEAYNKYTYPDLSNISVYDLSGDGTTLYYADPNDTDKLYMYKVLTGEIKKINDSSLYYISRINTNYYGDKVCYYGQNGSYVYLQKYDASAESRITTIKSYSNDYINHIQMNNNGGIIYYDREEEDVMYYSPGGTLSSVWSINEDYRNSIHIDISNNSETVACSYYNSNTNKINFRIYNVEKSFTSLWSESYDSGSETNDVLLSNNGSIVLYRIYNTIYLRDLSVDAERQIEISFPTKSLANNSFLFESVNQIYIYDPDTDTTENITPSDYNGISYDISDDGNVMAYIPSDNSGLRIWYRDGQTDLNRYLLSFDGKNTWYTYKGSAWSMVTDEPSPSAAYLKEYGMTESEVNALTAADFAPLYANGAEIYSVDVAAYFASVNPYTTPSISSITVVTDGETVVGGDSTTYLYADKSVDFAGSDWRKINKIYPIEISPKASNFLYFIYAGGKYQYYDGSAWQVESTTEIADLIADTEANWSDLLQIGMSTQELRAIPAASLTSQLAGDDFSVVYCMKVNDTSTEEYYSRISVDYTADLFASSSLTLSITFNDGTTTPVSGLTDVQVEDFMEWLYARQFNKGPIFYTIQTGSTSFFVNYYMIQSVTVVEN